MSALASILEAFFTNRLVRQRHASPHTIAAYRDTWRLLLRFAATEVTTAPSKLKLGDLDAPLIGRFLEHLERDRANTVRTRNARLSAIHARSATLRWNIPTRPPSLPASSRFRPSAARVGW